jgi:glycosyltransferase involved in cell wall biosynthesis
MKVLIISHKPPFPIIDGGCLAMSRFLECLSGVNMINQITYFSLSTHKHPYDSYLIPKENFPNVTFENHYVDTELKPFAALKDLVRGESYNLSRFYDKNASEKLRAIYRKTRFDFIIFESLFACVYWKDLNQIGNSKFIYRAHNIENSIWKNLSKTITNPLKKWYINNLHERLKEFEYQLINDVDIVFPLSTKDEESIQRNSQRPTYLIPVSMPIKRTKVNYENTNLCFIGAFNWAPNIEAMDWFTSEIFPEVRKEFPGVELHIAGSFSENIHYLKEKNGIVLHGFVESSLDFISEHGIFVAPLKSGSGVKMKVLEAMSLGSPIVVSEKGAEGIVGQLDYCRNSSEFADEIKKLLSSQELREENGRRGKKCIENNYNLNSIQKKLSVILGNSEITELKPETHLNSHS